MECKTEEATLAAESKASREVKKRPLAHPAGFDDQHLPGLFNYEEAGVIGRRGDIKRRGQAPRHHFDSESSASLSKRSARCQKSEEG